MYCWNCGHKNADLNKFCAECGKTLLVPELSSVRKPVEVGAVTITRAEETPTQPAETNPLLDEPRVVREKLSFTPAPKYIPESRQSRSDVPANRITGPSFLGLSDEPRVGGGEDTSYLLDDDQESSSWRGYLALAFLLIIGLLVVRQWTPIRDIAVDYAQRLGITDSPKRAKPNAAVSASTPEQRPADATQPPTGDSANPNSAANAPAEVAKNVKPAEALGGGKPENDNAAEKASKPDNSATKSKPESKPEAKSADESADSTDSADAADSEATSSRTASTKSGKSAAAKTPAATYDNSQVDLAQRYLQGKGVAQDCNRGVGLLRSAAQQPNPKARIQMGALYASGHCVTQDMAQAYSWFAKAQELDPNNTWIERNLNSLWAKMTDEERKRVLR